MAQNTQETFDWVSSAVKTYLGYLCFIFCRKWTRLVNERSVSSSNAIWSLASFSTATMYIYFFDFEVRVASRVRHTASHDRQFAGRLIKVVNLQLLGSYKNVSEHEYIRRKIRLLISLRYCRPAVCIQSQLLSCVRT